MKQTLQSLNRAFSSSDAIKIPSAGVKHGSCNPSIGLFRLLTQLSACRQQWQARKLQSLNRAFSSSDVDYILN